MYHAVYHYKINNKIYIEWPLTLKIDKATWAFLGNSDMQYMNLKDSDMGYHITLNLTQQHWAFLKSSGQHHGPPSNGLLSLISMYMYCILRLDYGGSGRFCSTHANLIFSLVYHDPKKNYISLDNQRRELHNDINYVNMDNEIKIRPKREYKN